MLKLTDNRPIEYNMPWVAGINMLVSDSDEGINHSSESSLRLLKLVHNSRCAGAVLTAAVEAVLTAMERELGQLDTHAREILKHAVQTRGKDMTLEELGGFYQATSTWKRAAFSSFSS